MSLLPVASHQQCQKVRFASCVDCDIPPARMVAEKVATPRMVDLYTLYFNILSQIIPTIQTLSPFNSFPTTGLACRSTRRSSLLLNLICRPLRYTTVRWYTLTSKGHKQIYFPICMIYFNHIGSYITHTRHPRCGVDAGMHIE